MLRHAVVLGAVQLAACIIMPDQTDCPADGNPCGSPYGQPPSYYPPIPDADAPGNDAQDAGAPDGLADPDAGDLNRVDAGDADAPDSG